MNALPLVRGRPFLRLVVKGPLYLLREAVYRRFDLRLLQSDFRVGPWSARDLADALRRDGCVTLPAYYTGDRLGAIQQDAERLFAERGEADTAAGGDGLFVVRAPYLHSRRLFQTATDPLILAVARNYFSAPVHLDCTEMYRIEPVPSYRGRAFQWHHDARGKQLKAMLLLSDVGAADQRMSYWRGSHRAYRFAVSYASSRAEHLREQLSHDPRVVECVGPAGTVVLFDSNGLHSGNRNESRRRDVLANVFHARRPTCPVPVDPAFLAGLSLDIRDAITWRS